jgi:hypothetical protein
VIPSLALVLILIAAILFLTRQRHRRRVALPPNATLVAADNLERPCPVLVSTRYGLKGKPDAILQTPAGLIPIERKHARPRASPHFPDIIQAAAYCLLIEDTYQQTPPFMRIQYRDTVFDVPFTNERRNQALAAAQRLRAVDSHIIREWERGHAKCEREHEESARTPINPRAPQPLWLIHCLLRIVFPIRTAIATTSHRSFEPGASERSTMTRPPASNTNKFGGSRARAMPSRLCLIGK